MQVTRGRGHDERQPGRSWADQHEKEQPSHGRLSFGCSAVAARLFRSRAISAANGTAFMMNAAQLVAAFLQIALGNSPLQAGLRFLPMTAMPLLVAPVAGLAVLGTLSAMAVGTRGRVSTGVPTRPASARPEATMAVALRQ